MITSAWLVMKARMLSVPQRYIAEKMQAIPIPQMNRYWTERLISLDAFAPIYFPVNASPA